jgi:hypothetical protein
MPPASLPPRQRVPYQGVPRQNGRPNGAPTSPATLHRLREGSTLDNALDYLDDQALEQVDSHLDCVELPDSLGVFVHADEPPGRPSGALRPMRPSSRLWLGHGC